MEQEKIQSRIYRIRGQQVMLDRELANLYGVTTSNLNKAVRRNIQRFPPDFLIRLTHSEYGSLRFQIGILEKGRHSKYLPFAFTQEGIAMLAGILNSPRAIAVNIAIMRAFVKIRHALGVRRDLAVKVERMEGRLYLIETDIRLLIQDMNEIKKPASPKLPKPVEGFRPKE